jgi:hypothetical protein
VTQELPQLDFATFILGIIGTTYVHMGDAPPDGDEDGAVNFDLARQNIDLLALLQKKTKGNLTGDEERLLNGALTDLKARYAELRGTSA